MLELTKKQYSVLEGLNDILRKHNYKKVCVSDIYCNMTAVNKIVAPNWFDRTFKALIEKGLVEKVAAVIEITKGVHAGKTIETYGYIISDLGFEYLGISNPYKTEELEQEEVEQETETIRPQLLQMSTKATGIRLAVINSILDQGDTDKELIGYIDNVLLHGCVSGYVTSLIYYKDTKQFFKEHCVEIAELLDNYYNEFKTLPVDEFTPNNLSWWSYEYILDEVAQRLDISKCNSEVMR